MLQLSVPFSSQTLLNLLADFDETCDKEKSHCVDVHIIRGALSNYFPRSYSIFFEKYFVFTTTPKPFGGF
jgi:hypothetical protein